MAVYQSPPGTRCSSGLSSPSSSSSWASSCSTANSSAEVLASKADTASCRTETIRQLTSDSPTAMQKLLGCRLTLPAVKTQLVPDPVLLLRTSMKAEHNEIKNKHKLPDVRKREDLTGSVGAGGLRSRRKQRYKRGDHHCQSKGICQPRRESRRLKRWAAWTLGPTGHCIKRLPRSAVPLSQPTQHGWAGRHPDVSSQASAFPKLHLYRARRRNRAQPAASRLDSKQLFHASQGSGGRKLGIHNPQVRQATFPCCHLPSEEPQLISRTVLQLELYNPHSKQPAFR